jgi:dTDP-4-dehydrorhamnose reductase
LCPFQPDVVIHSAAERRPDVVEKQEEATKSLNVDATSTVCTEAGR